MMKQLEAPEHQRGVGTSHKRIRRYTIYESAQMSLTATTNRITLKRDEQEDQMYCGERDTAL